MDRKTSLLAAALLLCPTLACDVPGADGLGVLFAAGQEQTHQPTPDPAYAPGGNGPGHVDPVLRLLLTDAPADVDAVFVTFDEVSVQACLDAASGSGSGGETGDEAGGCTEAGWLPIVDEVVTFDLLTLQDGVTAELGLMTLAEGDYGKIRLSLTEASVVVGGEELPVTVPSGMLQLLGGFSLEAGMQTELTIDFNAGQSLHHNNGQGWMLQPVIAVVSATTEPIPADPGDPTTGGNDPTGGSDGPEDPDPTN